MKILLRLGHTLSGADAGAEGIVKETDINREYGVIVRDLLQKEGHDVSYCVVDEASSLSESLYTGINRANFEEVDLFVSLHVNAGGGTGCEVIYDPGSISGKTYAEAISDNIALKMDYKNRGAKEDVRGLAELRMTNMPAVIVEPFFCDNAEDVQKYNPYKLAKAIAEVIVGHEIKEDKDMKLNDEANISDWAKRAVEICAEKGIFKGDDKGNFNPKEPITREQMAVLICRLNNWE